MKNPPITGKSASNLRFEPINLIWEQFDGKQTKGKQEGV